MHVASVAKLLDLIVGNVNDRGLNSTLPVIDILIQCFHVEVPQLISSTLQKFLVICFSGGDDHDPSKTAVTASSAAILVRILVMNTNFPAQLTSDPPLSLLLQQAGAPVDENILLCLVDIWLDRVDNVSSTYKKTFGLALSIILTLRLPRVPDKLDHILSNLCTSVILGGTDDSTEEESRSDGEGALPRKELRKRQGQSSTCASLHGESFNSAIARMHPAAFAQIKLALKMS
ncbi:hypothetical protein SLE2022_105470 [Rubroshorea leprosula]